MKHRVAGLLTLDDIEKTVPPFKAAALSRLRPRAVGAAGWSEACGRSAEAALDDLQQEFVSEETMIKIDRGANLVSVTPIVSWRSAEFIAAYDPGATGALAARSPVERAIVAFVTPMILPLEKEFLQKNEFKVTYHPFDWRLNDLTGGAPQ
jgi:hypothetical protein